MGEVWDVPQTEEGLQTLLHRLQGCRKTGDQVELGNGLLALSHLVKWVRSDTADPPFARSQELALEVLATFEVAKHPDGIIRALVAASALADPSDRQEWLHRAELLASELVDHRLLAEVPGA